MTIDDHPLSKALQSILGWPSLDLDLVRLGATESGVRDSMGKLAVVSENQKTLGVEVQSSDGDEIRPQTSGQQIEHGWSSLRI